jgi:homoaconitase/3-isopropylmalate dehydratase large subunit
MPSGYDEQSFVEPGSLVVATDSHTLIYGSLNSAGTGIGEAEMAWVLTYGELWFRVPETIKITVRENWAVT